jgi:hypothetical protein
MHLSSDPRPRSIASRPVSGLHIVRRVALLATLALCVNPAISRAAPLHRAHARPRTLSVSQGHAVKETIRTSATKHRGRSEHFVSFRASGLPTGSTAEFRPATVKPGVSTTLTLRTRSSTPLGTYTIDVSSASPARARRRVRGGHPRRHTPVRVAVVADKAPPSLTHIATWAYDDGCNGGAGASASLVRSWVTYAESNCGATAPKALSDCRGSGVAYCTAVQYLDASHIYAQGSVPIAPSAQENWWIHATGFADSGHRLSYLGYGGGNLLNQANPAVDNWFRSYVRANYNSYGALMMDDATASLSSELYGTGAQTSAEITTDASLAAAHEQMAGSLTHNDGKPFMQIDNALSSNPNLATPFSMLNNPANVTGVIAEGAPVSNGVLMPFYSTLLDEMAYVDHTANDFVVLLSYDPAGSLQTRRVQAATVLLGYSPGHTVSWSDLETNSGNLAVWPEQGIVPTDPVQSMGKPGGAGCLATTGAACSAGGHNGVQVKPGVFRREFGACYDRGSAFGACAAIVNTTSSPVTVEHSWLTRAYRSQITMSGGDVQSGGTIVLAGSPFSAGATTIPAHDALMLSAQA